MSEFNLAIFEYISNFKYPIEWKGITIHHSLTKDQHTEDWKSIDYYHTKVLGWKDIGYHAGMEIVNGRLYYKIGRPLDMQGAHEPKVNKTCIGICVVGNFDLVAPTKLHYWLLASLCRAFQKRFDISIENINFHRDYSNKTCPGAQFDKVILRRCIAGLV